jgi:hypothetical protein
VQHRNKLDPHWLIVSCSGCKLDPGWLLLHPVPLSVCHHGVLQEQAKTPPFQVNLIPLLKTYLYIFYVINRGYILVNSMNISEVCLTLKHQSKKSIQFQKYIVIAFVKIQPRQKYLSGY